jgi:small-conductance mechanosensitive channel
MGDRAQRTANSLRALGLAVILLLAATPRNSFGQTSAASGPAAAPPASAAIPLTEIATKASETTNFLATLSARFAPSPEIGKIQDSLDHLRSQIDEELANTADILRQEPTLATLQAQQAFWNRRHQRVTAWLTLLTQRAIDLRESLDRLTRIKETWVLTREAAQAGQAPAQILQQVETVLAAIEAERTPLAAQQDNVLDLQASIAGELARCDDALSQVSRAQHAAVTGILVRESPPIWSTDLRIHAQTTLPKRVHETAGDFLTDLRLYAGDPSMGMPLHAALLLALVLAFTAGRRKRRGWLSTGEGVSARIKVFERPHAAALMVSLFTFSAVWSPAPAGVKELFTLLALVPMIRLVRPVVDPRLAPGLYVVAALYALDVLRQALGGASLIDQTLLCLESLSAMGAIWWLLHAEPLRRPTQPAAAEMRTRALRGLARFVMIGLAVGLAAGALGYIRLARLITPGTLSAGALALMLYAILRVLSGAVALALRMPLLQRLQMVRTHGERIEGTIYRALVWMITVTWGYRSLGHIGLLDQLQSAGGAILSLKLERGSISVSVEDIFAFLLTVWASFLLSAFIRFILREEVYPRRGVARGMSYAYSRLIHYVILAVGFLVGLGVLGLDLTKVSVLAGAFGVGIGFGLQEVVNNFVCGLILLFERPVHVGDIVEVGDLQGEVRKIGIRASTVRTYRGADIIVPNSQFITANVTNWTLSDQLRRIDLPVGVNYAAAPKRVIEVLEAVARANPGVLEKPPPQCLFTGYGDSSINFELRAWTDRFDKWRAIRSELASAVYDAVYAAGMSFPFPQREVRLLSDPVPGALEGGGHLKPK